MAWGRTMSKKWFAWKNLGSAMPTLDIFDEIGGWGTWAEDVIDVLDGITAPELKVRLFSPGGYIDEGMQIYNALRRHPARVIIEIDAQAASIASVIAMAGDEIRMAETAFMMIHDPWSGVMGDASEMRKQADILDQLKGAIVLAYSKRTGLDAAKIEEMMTEETWMIAADAVSMGFADVVDDFATGDAAPSASLSQNIINGFQHIPEAMQTMFAGSASASMQPVLMLSPEAMKGIKEASTAVDKAGAMPEHKKVEVVMTGKVDNENAAPVDVAAVQQDALRVERERVNDITARAELAHGLVGKDAVEALARNAIQQGLSAADFSGSLLDAAQNKAKTQHTPLGLSDGEAQAFSFQRLLLAAATNDYSQAGFERDVCAATAQKMGGKNKGIMVPTDVLSIARPQNVVSSVVGAPTIQIDVLAASFIDLLRAKMKVRGMGATVLGGLQGNVSIPRQAAGASAFWVAEGAQPTLNDQTFDAVALAPKGVAAITQTTMQNLIQSSLDMEAFIRRDLAMALALAIDLAAISGTGVGNQPTGILNTAGIGSVAMGVNGGALTNADPLIALETVVADSNVDGDSMAYLTNARVVGALKSLKSTTGEYLFHNAINDGPGSVGSINGYDVTRSNQVSKLGAKGTGTGLSTVLFGNWSDLLIGEWGALNLQVDPFTGGVGNIKISALQFVDCGVRHPESFAAITDIIA